MFKQNQRYGAKVGNTTVFTVEGAMRYYNAIKKLFAENPTIARAIVLDEVYW